jgi:hypothetical protein
VEIGDQWLTGSGGRTYKPAIQAGPKPGLMCFSGDCGA